jgi:PIN domain nuclease of toxin-antitoxin system
MNLLLDTCALLALSRGDLPTSAKRALALAPEASVSVVSAWEVAIKVGSGKLRLPSPPLVWFQAMVERHDLREVTLDSATACAAAALPPLHRDPFDRVLVALAHARGLTIVSSDAPLASDPAVTLIW